MTFCADTNLSDPKCSQFTCSETAFSNAPFQSSNSPLSSELSSFLLGYNHKPNNVFSNSCKLLLSSIEFHQCNSLGLLK